MAMVIDLQPRHMFCMNTWQTGIKFHPLFWYIWVKNQSEPVLMPKPTNFGVILERLSFLGKKRVWLLDTNFTSPRMFSRVLRRIAKTGKVELSLLDKIVIRITNYFRVRNWLGRGL
jgi:hypothetical protein